MEKILYLECKSGISGDMTVGALLDLGADEQVLRKALASLPLTGYTVEISRVKKAGLDCCNFLVRLDAEHENHDHDMDYLYGLPKTGKKPRKGRGIMATIIITMTMSTRWQGRNPIMPIIMNTGASGTCWISWLRET